MDPIETVKSWYQESYCKEGFSAQRLYPNEELLRFFGRNYFSIPRKAREQIRVLDIGCGSCSNLWMIAKEGFETHGVDLSEQSLKLGEKMLENWGVRANLVQSSITELPYKDEYFDVITDVWVSYCLTISGFERFLAELKRVLKPNGRFFSYTPSTKSDAFTNYSPAKKIDEFTLDGVRRADSPYYGNFFPFRFSEPEWLRQKFSENGLAITYLEVLSRSYRGGKEYFELIVFEAVKSA